MTTRRTLSDLEISQFADELVIRARRMTIVVSTIAVFLLVPFSLAIAYKSIVGTADLPAIWDRPAGARIAVTLIMLLMELPFAVIPIVMCVVYVRSRRRPWVFNRKSAQLTRLHQSWPLADLTDVAVEVRRATYKSESAAVILHFRDARALEISRFHAGKNVSLTSRIVLAEALASTIGNFLQLPVRRPAPPGHGFEVVMPSAVERHSGQQFDAAPPGATSDTAKEAQTMARDEELRRTSQAKSQATSTSGRAVGGITTCCDGPGPRV